MNPKVLVTGAPGNIGSEVVAALQKQEIPLRIGAYDVEAAAHLFGDKNEIVHFDFLQPTTYVETFRGIERLFLLRPPALANIQRDIAPAIWAAVGAGVKHIVFLSIQGVEKNHLVPHYKIEQLILQTGLAYTFLRASFFMQNLSTTHRAEIRDHNEIAVPVGKAKTSFIDVRDIAAVAAQTLYAEGHANKKYTLTGAEALDYNTVAEKLSASLARPIRYTQPSVVGFLWKQLRSGSKLGYALVVTALYTITRFGNAKNITNDVTKILERPPISFDQFAHDYRDMWIPRN